MSKYLEGNVFRIKNIKLHPKLGTAFSYTVTVFMKVGLNLGLNSFAGANMKIMVLSQQSCSSLRRRGSDGLTVGRKEGGEKEEEQKEVKEETGTRQTEKLAAV